MAYNEKLADRVAEFFSSKKVEFNSKKMMGGLCFMVDDKMCVGVESDRLMARIGPDQYEAALRKSGSSEMNFTGKAMRGYVFVQADAVDLEEDLEYWLQQCLDFNPLAKSSKKKKAK